MAKADITRLNDIFFTGANTSGAEQEQAEMSGTEIKLKLLNENKTKRLNLVLQPTVHRMAQEKAKEQGTSLNNFIINAIINALEEK